MIKKSAILFASMIGLANAGPFLDLGLGYAIGADSDMGKSCLKDYSEDYHKWGCSDSPLGYLGIGYEHKGFSVQFEHWSSLQEYDAGIDIISIKYRFE